MVAYENNSKKPTDSFSLSLSLSLSLLGWLSSQLLVLGQVEATVAPGLDAPPAPRIAAPLLRVEKTAGPVPRPPATAVQTGAWTITQRDAHWQVWSAPTSVTNARAGRVVNGEASFVEIASGLNYIDERGQWQPTQQRFEITPEGYAVARFGPHKLILEPNINSPTAVDFQAADGVRLRSGPIAVGYFDPVSGRNLILATIQDSTGVLTAPNEVTYNNAFGELGSIRVTYQRAGMSADLLLNQALPDPELLGLSAYSRVELYTEFHPDTPAPVQTERVLRRETNATLRAQMAEPDFKDSPLDFGQYKMGAGTAFEWTGKPGRTRLPVAKQYRVIDGRQILIESVEWQDARKFLAALPPLNEAQWAMIRQQASSTGRGLAAGAGPLLARSLPARHPSRQPAGAIQQAQVKPGTKTKQLAFLLDYTLVTGGTNFTFAADSTYFVSGNVYLYGDTRLMGSAVIKNTNTIGNGLHLRGNILCDTTPYSPVIFTAEDDDTVGVPLPWSSGEPVPGNYADPALQIDYNWSGWLANLKHLRIAYAREGVEFYTGTGHVLQDAQFTFCGAAIKPYYCDVNLRNLLVYDSGTVLACPLQFTARFEHLTAHQVDTLKADYKSGAVYLTNSLLVAVDDERVYGGEGNASTEDSGVFQTVGAGAHYLADDTYRDLGTLNINSDLLADLKTRTTHPPNVQDQGWILADITLNPTVLRDTNNAPDLGYHYAPLDQVFHEVMVSNATLIVNPGTAIGVFGYYGDYGLSLWDGGNLVFEGSPMDLIHVARYNLVQEQASTNWASASATAAIYTPWMEFDTIPTASFRFVECLDAGAGVHHVLRRDPPGHLVWHHRAHHHQRLPVPWRLAGGLAAGRHPEELSVRGHVAGAVGPVGNGLHLAQQPAGGRTHRLPPGGGGRVDHQGQRL